MLLCVAVWLGCGREWVADATKSGLRRDCVRCQAQAVVTKRE